MEFSNTCDVLKSMNSVSFYTALAITIVQVSAAMILIQDLGELSLTHISLIRIHSFHYPCQVRLTKEYNECSLMGKDMHIIQFCPPLQDLKWNSHNWLSLHQTNLHETNEDSSSRKCSYLHFLAYHIVFHTTLVISITGTDKPLKCLIQCLCELIYR